MADDTNTAEREAAYDMVDRFLRNNLSSDEDYAEYSKALDLVLGASLAASTGSEPVAYAVFAENGNIRVWATEPQHVKRIAAEQGLKLVKLYTHPSPPEGAGWRPIETAPKDGTRVLLAGKGGKVADGRWAELQGIWIWPYVLSDPTSWMPAPPLPASEAKEL